jgi:hypothetical protein
VSVEKAPRRLFVSVGYMLPTRLGRYYSSTPCHDSRQSESDPRHDLGTIVLAHPMWLEYICSIMQVHASLASGELPYAKCDKATATVWDISGQSPSTDTHEVSQLKLCDARGKGKKGKREKGGKTSGQLRLMFTPCIGIRMEVLGCIGLGIHGRLL